MKIPSILEYMIASWLPYQMPASEVLLNILSSTGCARKYSEIVEEMKMDNVSKSQYLHKGQN
jgi:hypothetical protein